MKKILICVAHPDDETIGCGGAILNHVKNGDKVYCVAMTDGIGARDKVSVKKRNERKRNAKNAAKILNFTWLHEFSSKFPDNQLDAVKLIDIVKLIEKVKKKIKPNVIYTHNSSDLNIDHRKVFEATITAFRPQPKEIWTKIISFEIPSATDFRKLKKISNFYPNYFLDIKKFWKKKLLALKSYKDEIKPSPHSRSIEGIKILAKYRGLQNGLHMAEAFEIIKEIQR